MAKNMISDTNIKVAKEELGNADFIEDDIIMTDNMGKVNMATSPKRMTFIVLAMCTRGTATYTVDTQPQTVEVNDFIMVSDRHVVDDYSASSDLQGLCIMLSVNFFYEIVNNVSEVSSLLLFSKNHPVVKLSEDEARLFSRYFYMLKEKVADTQNRFRRSVVRTLLLAMFYDLSNVMYRMPQSVDVRSMRGDAIFTEFIQLLKDNFVRERRVWWYAEQLCITPKYLSETVKAVSKRTPNEWIDNYVTLELRVRLKNTTQTIKEIAREMNFPNQSFLGKYFKEHVGVSPSAYRKG